MREGCAHLYGRPLAAEREASAYPQQTADEFDRQENQRGRRQFAANDGLDVGNAAAGCMFHETAHEPHGEGCGRRRAHDHEYKAKKRLFVPPHW